MTKISARAAVTHMTLAITVVIAVLKGTASISSGAASAQAVSFQALGDIATQAFLVIGLHKARRDAPETYPWGFGRERYYWSVVTAALVFGVGGAYSLIAGLSEWADGDTPDRLVAASFVLAAGLALDLYLLGKSYGFVRWVRGPQPVWALRRRNPEAQVVLVEETTSAIGSVVALLGLAIVFLTDDPRGDAGGAIVLGGILMISAIVLIGGIKGPLVGEPLTAHEYDSARNAALRADHVARVASVQGQRVDPDTLSFNLCVIFSSPELSANEIGVAVRMAEEAVQAAFSENVFVTVVFATPPIEVGDIVEVRPKRGMTFQGPVMRVAADASGEVTEVEVLQQERISLRTFTADRVTLKRRHG